MLERRLVPYALAYAGYYAALGVLLPYLPAYLAARGLTGRQLGLVLSFSPFLASVTPVLVGYVADRTGRPLLILRASLVASTALMAALASASTFASVAAVMLAYAIVHPPILVLVEAATLGELAARGGVYARVRIFGSIAFVVLSLAAGLAIDRLTADHARLDVLRWVPLAAAAALAAQLAVAMKLPPPARVSAPVRAREALALLARPGLPLLLGASLLHWIAMAPYHTYYAVHVHALGLPDGVVGSSMALGATCEIVVMAAAARLERALGARTLLALAFGSGVVRWSACAVIDTAAPLVLVQALHGLSFGAFYVAAIGALTRAVPAELRATGQGLFIAVVFGVGGGLGTLLSGAMAERAGGAGAFWASAAVSLAAVLAWIALSPRPRSP